MGILKNFFRRPDKRQQALIKLQRRIDSFMRPSRSLLDSRDMTIPEKRQRYALFAYGAAYGLLGEDMRDETTALALLVMHLQGVTDMPEREISHLTNICMERETTRQGKELIAAGMQAVELWETDPGEAVKALAATLSAPV